MTGVASFTFWASFIAIFLIHFELVSSDGVLGCGGFVKSDVDINFSLVEVKLYTPHGSIKYQTDCAPTSGYYLIPLYEKGDFVLKVEPPAGWSFDPESIVLKVDGSTDRCSLGEDINFRFTGFSVHGKVVSKGQETGPSGVTVFLSKQGSADVLLTTTTGQDGSYTFSPVLPGDYEVRATTTQDATLLKAKSAVQVINDNAKASSDIVISGYKVTGQVQSDGEPMKGVNFIVFSKSGKKQEVTGCDKSPLKGFTSSTNQEPLCHVTSDQEGKFVFAALPVDEYYIVPFYKGEHIRFDVLPSKLDFQVQHEAVVLKETFQVEGFSVSGKVLNGEKGSGVASADVLVNGKKITKTETDGTYHLENMRTGTYNIQVQKQNIYFDELSTKITPNTPNLPDIIASEYTMCGKIVISKLPETLNPGQSKRRLIIVPQNKNQDPASIVADADGSFCTKVKTGKYSVQVHLTEEEKVAGLMLVPSEKLVTVTNAPVLDVTFSQFRAKVTGTVTCLEKCGAIEVSLDADRKVDGKQVTQVKETTRGGTFQFDNVMPGKYKVTLLQDSWCWKEKSVEIDVGNTDIAGLEFIQTGYILKCSISHQIKLHFAHEKKEGTVGSFQLNKGTNRFCLAQPGVYRLTPDSCHKFEKEVYTYDTSNPELLTLTAAKHLMEGSVVTEEPVKDLVVTIMSLVDKVPEVIGPLTTDTKPVKDEKTGQTIPGKFVYKFSHWARSSERLEISVKSKELLFSPDKTDVLISGEMCAGEVAKFTGKRGVFIKGQIKPALAGVKVTVTANDNSMDPFTIETTANGEYKIGPLHGGREYEVQAEKTGYVLVKEESPKSGFMAYKLGEVSVQVVDDASAPLASVLLSLSGVKQYRSNNVTKADGTIVFTALSPGEYFLRPMMKEYKFEPASQVINVQEATKKSIVIKGNRIAFSCYGSVTSLNGEPEPGVVIEAVGMETCSMYQEESKTEQDGSYRIRGLQPNCVYEIRLKNDVNKHIERSAPKSRQVKVENKDLVDMNVIAFRRINQMDVSGNVITAEEFLPSLKVRLFRDDNNDSPIHTSNLGSVTFFYLPSLPIDNEKYTLKLESSLSKTSYDFTLPDVSFTANTTYHHFTFRFNPIRKSAEQEIIQGSSLFLPFAFLLAVAAYNYQAILPVLIRMSSQAQAAMTSRPSDDNTGGGGGGGDATYIADMHSKKKLKARKT